MSGLGLCLSFQPWRRHVAAGMIFGPGLITSIPTFESAGLYWSPIGGGPDSRAYATYHQVGDSQERTSLDFVWDEAAGEYRGSLLLLESASDYEVTLWIEGKPVQTTSFATWSDTFPIARTISIPTGVQAEPYLVDDVHGSPKGYILYEPSDGSPLDGRNVDYSIQIQNSSHIIIRGFAITGTVKTPIYVNKAGSGGVNDLVIENNEITNWGRVVLYTVDLRGTVAAGDTITGATSGATGSVTEAPAPITQDGFSGHLIYYANGNGIRFRDGESVSATSGGSFTTHQMTERNGYVHGFGGYGTEDYAIETDNMKGTSERFIIQRNHIHTPRADTNSWEEYSIVATKSPEIGDDPPGTINAHPIGPGGIFFWDTLGNHVIRYNTIHGAPGPTPHHGDKNGHYLYDAIGGRPNGTTGGVHRDSDIYGNDIRYVWDDAIEAESDGQNVRIWGNYQDEVFVPFGLDRVPEGPLYLFRNIAYHISRSYHAGYQEGPFVKGDVDSGHQFILHNTMWVGPDGKGGGRHGINNASPRTVILNNIIHAVGNAYGGRNLSSDTNIDYELYQGRVKSPLVMGPNGIEAQATYVAAESRFLAPDTPGYGNALILPDLEWADRGAEQTGQPALVFGHDADPARR